TLGSKKHRSGLKTKAAAAMGCHTTLLSQVLHSRGELNLEQAEKLSRFLGHLDEESHYFILLVQKERAGTRPLKSYFQKQLDQILESRLNLKKRVGVTQEVLKEHEQRYYSSWIYSAVHIALSIPELRTVTLIAKRLLCPEEQVITAINFLLEAGLAIRKSDAYHIGPRHIHLGKESPSIRSHHRNWRLKAVESLNFDRNIETYDLHYSSVVSLSVDDISRIKDRLIAELKQLNKVIQDSKEEELYALNFDFFKV
ncbi:MAG: TIGR02147 family protein, partial [Bdellovibrionales bacterium]|nr:TIGR02147 family protein [Bdellovibrionales bacterium]